MNIIFIKKAHAAPLNINLNTWQGRLTIGGVLLSAAVFFVASGAAITWLLTNPKDLALREVRALRETINQQKHSIVNLSGDQQRHLDALALQLGQLQAQATRLNALGGRLTEVGKLDSEEFNFEQAPALGGPEEPASALSATLPLDIGIDQLRAEFARQEAELGVLENLLLDRQIDNALLPAGYPVAQGYMASGFGVRADPITGHQAAHTGIDFDAPRGSDISAVAEGVVTWAGDRPGYGLVVEIDHGNGYMTRYAHNANNMVAVGQRVHAGEVIAKVGSSGRATGSHCHFEVWLHGRAVNPLAYVRSNRATRT